MPITRIIIEMTPDEDGIAQGYSIDPSETGQSWVVHDHHEGHTYELERHSSLYDAVNMALDEAIVTS